MVWVFSKKVEGISKCLFYFKWGGFALFSCTMVQLRHPYAGAKRGSQNSCDNRLLFHSKSTPWALVPFRVTQSSFCIYAAF